MGLLCSSLVHNIPDRICIPTYLGRYDEALLVHTYHFGYSTYIAEHRPRLE